MIKDEAVRELRDITTVNKRLEKRFDELKRKYDTLDNSV